MRLPQRSSKAFTLIELIVVIVILGLLALIAIPTFGKVISKSQDESTLTTLRSIARDAQALRALDQGTTWGTSPQDAIGETSQAASAGLFAAALKATADNGTANPVAGEVTYKVVGDSLVLSMLSGSKRICLVGATTTSTGQGKCVEAGKDTAGVPTTSSAATAWSSDTSILPSSPAASPAAGGPEAFTLSSTSVFGKLMLNWSASKNATTYKVERSSAADMTNATVLSANQTALTYTDNAPGAGTWYYRVSAAGNPGTTPAAATTQAAITAGPSGELARTVQFGSTSEDLAQAVSVATDGTTYVAGTTRGSLSGTNYGDQDGFLAAYAPDGTQKWIRQFGNASTDRVTGSAVASDGTVYVTGFTDAAFAGKTSSGSEDSYLVAYAPDGTQKWLRQFGSASYDEAQTVSVGKNGEVYVAGMTGGSWGATMQGGYDVFIVRYESNGTQTWVQQYGGSGLDAVYASTVLPDGNIYLGGSTSASLFTTSSGGDDALLLKYSPSGSRLAGTQYGSGGNDIITSLVSNGTNGVYAGGYTNGNLSGMKSFGNFDSFVSSYDSSTQHVWTRQAGSAGYEEKGSVAVGSDGTVYMAATAGGLVGSTQYGGSDIFVAAYTPAGVNKWIQQYGSAGSDGVAGAAMGANGMLQVVGKTNGKLGAATYGANDAYLAWVG